MARRILSPMRHEIVWEDEISHARQAEGLERFLASTCLLCGDRRRLDHFLVASDHFVFFTSEFCQTCGPVRSHKPFDDELEFIRHDLHSPKGL